MTPYSEIFILFAAFQLKHYLADFCFQHDYMLKKIRPGWDFIGPLSSHCAVHAVGTLIICLSFDKRFWWLALVDFVIHFAMDRLKASPNFLGRYDNPTKPSFWRVLGFDQMIHHLTDQLIIMIMVLYS